MLHRTVLAVVILATAMSYAAKAETEAERQACFNDAQSVLRPGFETPG